MVGEIVVTDRMSGSEAGDLDLFSSLSFFFGISSSGLVFGLAPFFLL